MDPEYELFKDQRFFKAFKTGRFSTFNFRLFVVLCGYHNKNQSGLELKIILPIENGEEPNFI
jgi:hypothetical protein